MLEKVKNYTDKSKVFIKSKFSNDGIGWLFLQQLIIAPMSLLTTILLANILSVSDYGYYKYILSVYGIIAVFGFIGFHSISLLNVQRGEDEFFYIGFKYRKLSRWIPALFSLLVSLYYFYQSDSFLGCMFLMTIFSHLYIDTYDFYSVATMGRGDYILNLKLAIVNYFISFFPPILIAYITHNIYLVFITMYLFQFVFKYFAFNYVINKLNFKMDSHNEIGSGNLKAYKKEVINVSYNTVTMALNASGANAIVFNRLGVEAAAVYSLATTFADFVFGIIYTTTSKLLLIFSRISKGSSSQKEKLKLISRFSKRYFLIALLVTVATMFVLPLTYKFFFAKYLFSYKYAVVYALSIMSVAFVPAYQYLYEERKIKLLNTIQTTTVLIGLVTLFLAAMYFGLWGAIVVTMGIRFINYVIASVWVSLKG